MQGPKRRLHINNFYKRFELDSYKVASPSSLQVPGQQQIRNYKSTSEKAYAMHNVFFPYVASVSRSEYIKKTNLGVA